jgi:hypothetical protein
LPEIFWPAIDVLQWRAKTNCRIPFRRPKNDRGYRLNFNSKDLETLPKSRNKSQYRWNKK